MPLPGGETDKIGNRYEGRWTVFCMIDVMDEKADSMRLEQPGEDAFEFFVVKNGKLECHQVKRQKGGRGRWTLSALEDKQVQVLSDFWKSLSNPDVYCVFVSTQDADELGELANRARDAACWTEFERDFLNNKLSGKFDTLRQKWRNCSEIAAFEALKRVRVETVGEQLLVDIVESRLAALVEGDPKTIRIELAELALLRIHHELTAHDIWHYLLQERGYRRREWGKDPHILAAVETANNLYISSLRDNQAIAGDVIPRDEAQIAFEELTERKQSILLEGEAGVGKSGVTLQVLEKLHNQGFPVLTFRVDRLEPTLLPDNVGQQLGLPGSPAIVLANIAQKRDCVLVIDQLDAVSLASGRNPQFFDCVAEIIKQAQAHSNIRVLLACRKFDLENDNRLKRLGGEKGIARLVTINRLAHSTVREVVAKLGLDATRLTEKQLNLLSIPLHLGLLAEIAQDTTTDALNIQTAKELYDQFWKYKHNRVRERLGRSVQWTQIIDVLCDYMSSQQQQSLSAPERVVDDFVDDANAMASEHILTWEGKRISFFHESFFDYAFARRFAARGQELLSFLGRREQQHLFRRAQVRQILIHQREEDFDSYLDNLKELLTSSNIRFHIKQVVFALLAALNDPSQKEWEIVAPFIADSKGIFAEKVWGILRSSASWFQLIDNLGIVEQWLNSQHEKLIDKTVVLLSIMQKHLPERVAELVESFVGVSETWSGRLVKILKFAELSIERRFFNLFLRLISTGVLDKVHENDDIIDRDFWSLIYELPKQNPEWACEAISHYLDRRLDLSIAAGQINPFDRESGAFPHSHYYKEVLIESADKASKAFIQYILPFMLRVIDLTAIRQGNPPWKDLVWIWRMYGDDYGIDNALLNKMEVALSSLAVNHPEDFATIAEQYLRQSNFETIQYLLVRAYAANGERFADEAIDYLCEQPVRLETGGGSCRNGIIGDEPYWATQFLVKVTTPYCSQDKLIKLEAVILDYYTDFKKSAKGFCYRGEAQFLLLEVIDSSRRTEVATRRLEEWRRKFPNLKSVEILDKIEPPESIEDSLVKSPIPEKAADKMTDEQWLKAIARYDYDDLGTLFQRTGKLIGGAHQLSSLLENKVKKEPARFASLIWRFPDNANSSYFDAVLHGIAEVGLDVETTLRVCQRCHQLPQRPCGRSIAWLFQKLPELPWCQEALDILIWYVLNDPEPEQELWRTKTQSGDVYGGGSIINAGINSTRGSGVSAIAKLIFADKNRTAYFQGHLQQIVRDPSIAVRSCAAEALTAVLNYDRDLAISLFLELCDTEDALLGTPTVERFLYYVLPSYFQQLAPILERMITSDLPEVVRIGARQACRASLTIEEARPEVERCLCGRESHRISVAEIFVANFRSAHFRQFCEAGLIQLFNDSDDKVRASAASCFLQFEGEQLGEYRSLVEAFVESRAFETNCRDFINALKKTTAKLPDVTYLVCEKIIDSSTSTVANSTRSIANADKISELLIRVYSQSKDETLRSRCLDLVDKMSEREVYGLDQALQQFER